MASVSPFHLAAWVAFSFVLVVGVVSCLGEPWYLDLCNYCISSLQVSDLLSDKATR